MSRASRLKGRRGRPLATFELSGHLARSNPSTVESQKFSKRRQTMSDDTQNQIAEQTRKELAQKELLNLELKKGLTELSNGCMGTILVVVCVFGLFVAFVIVVAILQAIGLIKS